MARINLLSAGMQGVDLKSNPLIIGEKKKLRFATNMIFDEGVFRTRYGIRYTPLCCAGQFQGAVDFQPARGLSYIPHSSLGVGVAVVVRGSLYFKGEKISGNIWKDAGAVNLFQAENYLIIQNLESDTYWWDGETLTKSPGMNVVDFAEIETPIYEREITVPDAETLTCESGGDAGSIGSVHFYVVNDETDEPIPTPSYVIEDDGILVDNGDGDSAGEFIVTVPPGSLTYSVTKEGFFPVEEVSFTMPNYGVTEIAVRMVAKCGTSLTNLEVNEDGTVGTFIVNNTGNTSITITSVDVEDEDAVIVPELPVTLGIGESQEFTVTALTSLEETTLTVLSSCVDFEEEWPTYGSCGLLVDPGDIYSNTGGNYTVTNIGTLPVTITVAEVGGGNGVEDSFTEHLYGGGVVTLPLVLAPGDFLHVARFDIFEGEITYVVEGTCGGGTLSESGVIGEV